MEMSGTVSRVCPAAGWRGWPAHERRRDGRRCGARTLDATHGDAVPRRIRPRARPPRVGPDRDATRALDDATGADRTTPSIPRAAVCAVGARECDRLGHGMGRGRLESPHAVGPWRAARDGPVNLAGHVLLFAWLPATLAAFAVRPGRSAALASLLSGYLLLPQGGIAVPGMVDVTRTTVIGLGLLMGMLLFDAQALRQVRLCAWDLPMVIWCACPIASSLANDQGIYDGLSSTLDAVLTFGVPYLAGRAYLQGLADLRAAARALVVAGALYLPLCWFELRFSPQLHHLLFGFTQHVFAQTRRAGGWRPMVFLQHGLALSFWLAAASVTAYTLWRGKLRMFRRIPDLLVLIALVTTTVLCRSMGAALLLSIAILALATSWRRPGAAMLVLLAAIAPVFLVSRTVLGWEPGQLVELAKEYDPDRGASLATRSAADAMLLVRAKERPWFGWGSGSGFREGIEATDSLWGITVGKRGYLGLFGLFGVLFVAPHLGLRRLRRAAASPGAVPEVAAPVAVLAIYGIDCLSNAMICPVFFALAGGLTGWGSRNSP